MECILRSQVGRVRRLGLIRVRINLGQLGEVFSKANPHAIVLDVGA